MQCPYCKTQVPEGKKFCTSCGKPVQKVKRMVEPIFDRKEQLQKIKSLLVPNETLYAVFDCKGGGTGFVGITDLRLIFMDQAFLRKQKAVVSLPYTKVTMIASEDSGKIILGSILGSSILTIVAGNNSWNFQFRSNAKAHKAYMLIMQNLLQLEAKGLR